MTEPSVAFEPDAAPAVQREFERLQQKLVPLWNSIRAMTDDEQSIVVVPSMNVDMQLKGCEMQAYEERFLFLLLLLRQPRARLIYVTSQAIHPHIVEYYLSLLPGVVPSQARPRLFLLSPLDASPKSLTVKLLERPRLIEHIRSLIPNPDRAHLVPYSTTPLERDLAVRLGIPMYGADPKFFPLGTKTGCRRLFAEEGVPHPLGRENLESIESAVQAIVELRAAKPSIAQVLLKMNEGVSGEGNALVDLCGLSRPNGKDGAAVLERVRALKPEKSGWTFEEYAQRFERVGGVVEERLVGDEFRSPSVQLRITPLGEVELLSTHDQLLGGPSGQSYLGCVFPADRQYAPLITREAAKIGQRLKREGVLGRFALDFVVTRPRDGAWEANAIEINLRKGGTTHPFLTLQFLTEGAYDPEQARFVAPDGQEKCFVASDHVESPDYRGFTPDDIFEIAVRHRLHFHQARETGVVFHMLAALGECGRFGLTAVGNSPAEAEALYRRTQDVLSHEARKAVESA